jgi:hypothetical protein
MVRVRTPSTAAPATERVCREPDPAPPGLLSEIDSFVAKEVADFFLI